MGNFLEKATLLETFSTWTHVNPNQIRSIARKFEQQQTGFGWNIERETYMSLFQPRLRYKGEQEWAIWNPSGSGNAEVLEAVAALTVISRGTFAEKVKLMFDLFDADTDNCLNKQECITMFTTVIPGLCKIMGLAPVSPAMLNTLGQKVFVKASEVKETDTYAKHTRPSKLPRERGVREVSRFQFGEWVRVNAEIVNVMCMYGTTDKEDAVAQLRRETEHEKATEQALKKVAMNEQSKRLQIKKILAVNDSKNFTYRLKDVRQLKRIFDEIDLDQSGEITIGELASALKTNPHMLEGGFLKLLDKDGDGTITFMELLSSVYPTATQDQLATMSYDVTPPRIKKDTVVELSKIFIARATDESLSQCRLCDLIQACESDPETLLARCVRDVAVAKKKSSQKVDFTEFLELVFGVSHLYQFDDIVSWRQQCAIDMISQKQRLEMQQLWGMYDAGNTGCVVVAEMRQKLQEREATGVEQLIMGMDVDGDGTVTFEEFVRYYAAVLSEAPKHQSKHHSKKS